MTIATVQLIMGSLGLIAALLIASLGPGDRWIRWPLACATGAGVAITGWPKLWLVESGAQYQLFQSLMLAAVVVLLALLTMMLLKPVRETSSDVLDSDSDLIENAAPTDVIGEYAVPVEAGRDPIAIDLSKNPNVSIAHADNHALMHLLRTGNNSSVNDEPHTNELLTIDVQEPQPLTIEVVDDLELVDPSLESDLVAPHVPAEVVSLADRRVQRDDDRAANALDLSDSEELYQAMREAEADLELPDEPSWLNDTIDGELDDQEHMDDAMHIALTEALDDDIVDAEILSISGDIDHAQPVADIVVTSDDASEQLERSEQTLAEQVEFESIAQTGLPDALVAKPETLDAALQAQRNTVVQLKNNTNTLADKLNAWSEQADAQEQKAWVTTLKSGQAIQKQNERINAESSFREAASELINTQRDVMTQLSSQISSMGQQRKKDLATLAALQKDAINQRRLARQAALLARKAAADKQALTGRLSQEKQHLERTQTAAKRAISIAREAVDRLAEHERRLGISK